MTEPEDLDDDLFADLYDGDDFSKPRGGPPAPSESRAPKVVDNPPDSSVAMATAPSNIDEGGNLDPSEHHMSAVNEDSTPAGIDHNGQEVQQLESEHDNQVTGIKEDGKMFIGGLNWETNDQAMKEYFSQFGEVLECTVMRDGATGRSRGFGFLTFKDPKTVNIVMVKEHYLGGKIVRPSISTSRYAIASRTGRSGGSRIRNKIDPKRAIPRDEQERTSKIFVGGVSQEATEDDFKNYFMQFGRVLDATLMIDKDTGRPRGFGFVTFDSENAVDIALASNLEIHGKPIEVKKAQPRGNVQNEDVGRHGRRGGKDGGFNSDNRSNDQNGGQSSQSQQGNSGSFSGGMTPQVMAQYWQKMQAYFAMMQTQMAAANGMGGQMGMAGMNPAMMAQMQQLQQMQAQGNGNMTPAMMQQMQQMQQMGMQGGGGGFGGGQVPTGPAVGGPPQAAGPGYNAYEQQMFEQQKYEQQQARRGGGGQQYQQYPGGPTSWEGMYDEVPQPNMGPQGGAGGRGGGIQNNFGRSTPSGPGGAGGGRGQNRGSQGPAPGPASAPPANAPTGPKNAGRPGANYRGGGRSGHRGFHPYSKG